MWKSCIKRLKKYHMSALMKSMIVFVGGRPCSSQNTLTDYKKVILNFSLKNPSMSSVFENVCTLQKNGHAASKVQILSCPLNENSCALQQHDHALVYVSYIFYFIKGKIRGSGFIFYFVHWNLNSMNELVIVWELYWTGEHVRRITKALKCNFYYLSHVREVLCMLVCAYC